MSGELAALRQQPFALLQALDQRLRASQTDVTHAGEDVWTGVALRVQQQWVVVPQADVREIVPPPPLAHVPGARPFLRGVANLRGSLLPVTDLAALAGGRPAVESRQQRVVVLNSQRIPAGFLVDVVAGYRSFGLADQRHSLLDEIELPREWLLGVFARDAQVWPVLSLQRVARSSAFVETGRDTHDPSHGAPA